MEMEHYVLMLGDWGTRGEHWYDGVFAWGEQRR
jgi:hypothetical protein